MSLKTQDSETNKFHENKTVTFECVYLLQEGWVSSISTAQQLQAKAQSKQDAIMKRQRAMVYTFSEQVNSY